MYASCYEQGSKTEVCFSYKKQIYFYLPQWQSLMFWGKYEVKTDHGTGSIPAAAANFMIMVKNNEKAPHV